VSPDMTPDTEEFVLRVEERQGSADDVVTFTLAAPGGGPLAGWEPGAHVDVLVPELGPRQYSLCGDPGRDDRWRIAVLREPAGRGGSQWLHERVQPGDELRFRGPRNHFPLEPAQRYLFIAGGIGITPLLPMIAAVQAAGTPWSLVYGGRRRSSMAFLEELVPHGQAVQVRPQDTTGLLDLQTLLAQPQAGTAIYCCGPEPLIEAVEKSCAQWPSSALHVERFHPAPAAEPVLDDAFEVVLERSGLTLEIPPDRSVLDVVEDAGVPVLSSCAEGTCGTCETTVLDGVPDHRDSLIDDPDTADTMMICVSRSCSHRLVLDL
jgi:ferredoxin-NADP reductase